jgi:hypothetical protein
MSARQTEGAKSRSLTAAPIKRGRVRDDNVAEGGVQR